MFRSLRFLPMLTALFLAAFPTLAWGPEGHAIVADIAQRHLTSTAAAEVHRLLALEGYTRLDQISSLPDARRATHRETGPWHYVDIPLHADGYKASRDCPHGDCVVDKLPFFVRVLADRKNAPEARLQALIWVVHLVGDIHQPLHNEDDDDKGGNTVQMVYFGKPTNLHRVWDSAIIGHATGLHTNPDYTFDHAATRKAAMRLDAQISSAERAQWSPAQPVRNIYAEVLRWSDHSHTLARTVAYADLPSRKQRRRDKNWSMDYQRKTWPVVKTQLQSAGVRLAAVLNAALR